MSGWDLSSVVASPSWEGHIYDVIYSWFTRVFSCQSLFLSLLDFFCAAQALVIRCSCCLLSCHPVHCLWLRCLHAEFASTDQILATAVSESILISPNIVPNGLLPLLLPKCLPNQQTSLCNILPMESWVIDKLSNVVLQKVDFFCVCLFFNIFLYSFAGLSTLDTFYCFYQIFSFGLSFSVSDVWDVDSLTKTKSKQCWWVVRSLQTSNKKHLMK